MVNAYVKNSLMSLKTKCKESIRPNLGILACVIEVETRGSSAPVPIFSAEVSERHFGTGAELSGHFGTSLIVPKCLGSEVSWVRSVLTPPAVHLFSNTYPTPCLSLAGFESINAGNDVGGSYDDV